ncbi:MAG: isochorismatase family protein, partial [Alphaproteobacteria bacterium]|nr:isochorismatase family protein [Alphaproteobacteria bacterium]
MSSDIEQALNTLFSLDSEIYKNRGFQRRIGFGTHPALIIIDLANAWTQPGYAFTCDGIDEIIAGVQQLLQAFRAKGLPVVYTTTAYDVTEGPMTDMGLWHKKIPAEELKAGSKAVEIDDRIAPLDNELVIVKKRASAFHGTPLAGFLRAAGVDTVVVTGATACACVRSSIEDALAEGFRPIAVRECIGDRIPGAV